MPPIDRSLVGWLDFESYIIERECVRIVRRHLTRDAEGMSGRMRWKKARAETLTEAPG